MSQEILHNGNANGHGDRPPVDDRPLPQVIAALRAGPVRATDVAALSDLDRAGARELARAWPSLSDEARIAIVREMEELAEERVELTFGRALRIALDDQSPVVRQLAVAALWEDTGADLLARLRTMFEDDPSDDVRSEAAKALGRFAEQAAADELEADAADSLRATLLQAALDESLSPVVQRRAIEAVGAFGRDELVRDAIEQAYGSEDQSMQASALFAMGRSHDSYWLALLLGELASAEAELRFESARACGTIGHEDAVPELAALCADEDTEVRHAAITALGQIGGRNAVRALESLASPENEADAELIAESLEEARASLDPLQVGS